MLAATESPEAIVVYVYLYSIPLSLVPALVFWQWPSGEQWLWLLALGVVANGNMYGISRALRIGDASLSQPFDFIRLICTALVGYFAFAEQPDLWTWLGAAIIFACSVYITHREARAR
jgi:drug/metabolite transporter (DMT)-like permease